MADENVSPEEVQEANVLISRVFEDIFKSLLGPIGSNKLITKEMTKDDVRELITNKGLSVVRELSYEHPTADMIINAGLTQGEEVGDGVTSVFIMVGNLVKEGFEVQTVLEGLGSNDQFADLFVDHIADAAKERNIVLQ